MSIDFGGAEVKARIQTNLRRVEYHIATRRSPGDMPKN